MPPRLGHKKSRAGCSQCKSRRVKVRFLPGSRCSSLPSCPPFPPLTNLQCDETRPVCSACARHAQECSFLHAPPTPAATPAAALVPGKSAEPSGPLAVEQSARPANGSRAFDLSDLRLFHHFTSETASAIAMRPDLLQVFTREVPILAYDQEYLMRAILAMGALHIASLSTPNVDQAMVATASYHLNESLVLSKPHLAHLTQHNCHAVFAFSALVSLYSFALPLYQTSYGTPSASIDRIVEVMELIRGTSTVVAGGSEWVGRGPLRPIMEHAVLPPPPNPMPPQIEARLAFLNAHVAELNAAPEEIAAYRDALWSLERSFKMVFSLGACNHINYALAWAALISPMYLEAVRMRKPPALAILGYFCPLLQKHWGGWIVAGWQSWLLKDIEAALRGTFWCESTIQSAAQLNNLLSTMKRFQP
ncbi:hypothetical protein FH972_026323 [Carpinus fangiana]|uniref:Zn(2)-C6 fungal-type domain-containing protein n=1 Tax=Carpinus fangiana TaxID=176857 RepID=A0A5N6L3M2_9ROSI|nr:hypothetical protein FH972_026323 [Carpinus fangiana]